MIILWLPPGLRTIRKYQRRGYIKLSSQTDIDAGQGSRDRAVLFGVLRMFFEGRRRHLGDQSFVFEIDPMDGSSTVVLFEMDPRCSVDAFDSDARIRQLKRQRH